MLAALIFDITIDCYQIKMFWAVAVYIQVFGQQQFIEI